MMGWVAIDFETAESFPGSVCAVGLASVVDARIIDDWSSLIRPPKGYDYFDPWHVNLHGNTAADVTEARVGEQTLKQSWCSPPGTPSSRTTHRLTPSSSPEPAKWAVSTSAICGSLAVRCLRARWGRSQRLPAFHSSPNTSASISTRPPQRAVRRPCGGWDRASRTAVARGGPAGGAARRLQDPMGEFQTGERNRVATGGVGGANRFRKPTPTPTRTTRVL